VRCVSIEHKLGIHASPTCVMAYGDKEGAIGYLVGEENRGLEYMFIMMNAARFGVGIEGVAIAERAYQRALALRAERVQGREAACSGGERVTIIHHPDVRRMLMTMKAQTEAMRALAYVPPRGARSRAPHPDEEAEPASTRRVDLLIRWSRAGAPRLDRDRLARRAGPRRHGLRRGNRRGAVPARRAHHHHLRGHHRHPGQRPVGRKILRDGGAAIREVIGAMREAALELDESVCPGTPRASSCPWAVGCFELLGIAAAGRWQERRAQRSLHGHWRGSVLSRSCAPDSMRITCWRGRPGLRTQC
jgi:3-(methylthio)propanoyl-CoA dehydrogenase